MKQERIYDIFHTTPLKRFYLRVFDVRQGEVKRVMLMQLTIFLLISTVLLFKPTINSLFLSEVGIKKLPIAFILVAFLAGIITLFYSRFLNRIPLNKIIQFTLFTSVIALSAFSVLLKMNWIDHWVLYFFYAWISIFGVLATSQFWILANLIFNAREAKRLFSLIGGAAIAGGIFGGYLTSVLASLLGSENLLFIGVLFLLACIPLTRLIWKSNTEVSQSVFIRKERMGKVSEHPLRLILNSKHLTYMAVITALSVLVAKLVEFQFSAISSQKITNPDDLTAFFGFWFSNFNILSLLIQLFITRRVVGMYGVGVSLFFLPVGILLGAISILVSPGLFSAIFIKASDGSLKQSVNKSATELLALPIPGEIKQQTKTFIDVFVDSFATGFGGILLIILISGFNISVQAVSILILLLIGLWIRFIVKIRQEYISQFKSKLNLQEVPVKSKGGLLDLTSESVYSGLLNVLESGSDKQILYVLKHTDDLKHEKLFTPLKKLLAHPSPEIVLEAIRKLYFYRTENLSEQIAPLVHAADAIKVAAIEYLIEHAGTNRMELLQHYLRSADVTICLAALLALSNETRDTPEIREQYKFTALVEEKLQELIHCTSPDEKQYRTLQLLHIISAAKLTTHYAFIVDSLSHSDEAIQKAATKAAGRTLDGYFIPLLLESSANIALREEATSALAQFGFRLIEVLQQKVRSESLSTEIICNIPIVLEKIGTQYGVDYLFELLEYKETSVRNQAVICLWKLKQSRPHLTFYNKRIIHNIYEEARLFMNTLTALYVQQENQQLGYTTSEALRDANNSLIHLLEKRLDDNLYRIFKFLGLKYPPDEINTIYRELKSGKTEMRINAIEFLDNLLDTDLKRILIPIIETSLTETITREVLKDLKIKIIGQHECFTMLMEGKDVKLKLAVLYLLSVLKDQRYLPLASNYANHPDKKIKTFALKAIRAMSEEPNGAEP